MFGFRRLCPALIVCSLLDSEFFWEGSFFFWQLLFPKYFEGGGGSLEMVVVGKGGVSILVRRVTNTCF